MASDTVEQPVYVQYPAGPGTSVLPKAELLSVSREQGYLVGPPPLPSDNLVYVVDVCADTLYTQYRADI
jgi:hypothetical protein